jgi:hypothetical protein
MKKLLFAFLLLFSGVSHAQLHGGRGGLPPVVLPKWQPVSGGTVQKNTATGAYRWVFGTGGGTFDPSSLYAAAPSAGAGADGIITGMDVAIIESEAAVIDTGHYRLNDSVFAYTTPTPLFLQPQDSLLSRYEIIYVDSTAKAYIVAGDLSATPIDPEIPDSTLAISEVLITPTSVTTKVVIPSFVPYTGATASVNIGLHAMTARNFVISVRDGNGWMQFPVQNNPVPAPSTIPAMRIFYTSSGFSWIDNAAFTRTFGGTITANRNYTLPDESGTVALLSDLPDLSSYATTSALSAYLPLAGGSMTGSINFSPSDHINFTDGSTIYTQYQNGQILYNSIGSGSTFVEFLPPTHSNTVFFPNENGILATTGDLAAYFPIAGGSVTGNIVASGNISAITGFYSTGYSVTNGSYNANISTNTLTNYRTLKIPDESGVFALYNTTVPTSSSYAGQQGQLSYDGTNFYFYTGTQWLKVTGSTF